MHTLGLSMLAAALYGTALVTTYCGLAHLPALAGARVSVPTAALLFWLIAPAADWSGLGMPALALFALVGLFYPAAVTLLTFVANRRLGPTVSGTIGSTTPLFAVLGAAAFLGEAPGAREMLATAVIVAGTIILSNPAAGAAPGDARAALWLPWSAALLRALAQVLSKAGLALWPSPFTAAAVGYLVSAGVVWAAGGLVPGARAAITWRGAAWFAATGVLNGAAVLMTYYALLTGPVQLVAPVVATYPLYTLALSMLFLRRERPGRRAAGGAVLTVAGIVLLLSR